MPLLHLNRHDAASFYSENREKYPEKRHNYVSERSDDLFRKQGIPLACEAIREARARKKGSHLRSTEFQHLHYGTQALIMYAKHSLEFYLYSYVYIDSNKCLVGLGAKTAMRDFPLLDTSFRRPILTENPVPLSAYVIGDDNE